MKFEDLTGLRFGNLTVISRVANGKDGATRYLCSSIAVFENHGQDSRLTGPLETSPTISQKFGTGGNNTPLVVQTAAGFKPNQGAKAHGIGYQEEVSPTLNTDSLPPAVLQKTERSILAYRFDALSSNSMKSSNPNSGGHFTDVCHTLNASIPDPAKNQGGIAIIQDVPNGTIEKPYCIGNGQTDQTRLSETVGTLNCMHDQQAVVVPIGIGRDAFNQGTNAKFGLTIEKDLQPPLLAKGPGATLSNEIVRRLTPLECERLQGYPDNWTVLPQIENMTDYEYKFWKQILLEKAIREGKARKNKNGEFEIWRKVETEGDDETWENTHKPHKDKTKDQMVKWYNKSFTHDTDSARYKALGNSIALPPWRWVIKRLCGCYERPATMASLFDGIGGFPLIWEQFNGKGSCLWVSEIEEFPIAVTMKRFPEEER